MRIEEGNSQFLNAVLALVALAGVDLLLAVREVLRVRRALGRLRALVLERGEDLKHKQSVRTPRNPTPASTRASEKRKCTHVLRLLLFLFLLGLLLSLLLGRLRDLLLLGGVGVNDGEDGREQ